MRTASPARERGSRHFATYARSPFSIEPGQTQRVPLTLSRHAAKFLEGDEYLGPRVKVADAEAHAERGVSLHFPRPAT